MLASPSASRKQGEQNESKARLYWLKARPQYCTSSRKATPPKPQTAPPTGNQLFKHLGLWGHSHSSVHMDRPVSPSLFK